MKELIRTKVFDKWLYKLKDIKGKFIINERLERLEIGDYGDSKPIINGNGICELRIHYGGYRVYYIEKDNEVVVLLIGGDKDSQIRNIKLAKKLAKYYS
ncbi:MAG: type II toxin-antitoxin system RelE/ParE family toxin [Spirochaetaceae bacterium]|nr:type II toxin-antitoxin system RelE/ParE family toxin [Spirochaetaceae bacterium]